MRSNLVACITMLAGLIGGMSPASAGTALAASTVAAPAVPPPAAPLAAPDAAPDALLSEATSVVIARLRQDKDLASKGPANIADLVETTILPLFDFRHMTQLAVARNWQLATPDQQHSLIAEFRTLLVRTYSAALANYRDEAINYKSLHVAPGETDVTVKSTVKKPGVERMTIDYDMEKLAEGWKVYDIRIAGISLTTTYRSSFAEIVRDGGIDELIRFLAAKNRQTGSGPRSDDSEARGILLLYGMAPSLLRGQR